MNEEHFGPIGDAADPSDPSSDWGSVTLVYNVQDENYYDCAVDHLHGRLLRARLRELRPDLGMNVITLDAFDWANRIGEDPSEEDWSDGDPANNSPSCTRASSPTSSSTCLVYELLRARRVSSPGSTRGWPMWPTSSSTGTT